MVFGKTKRRKSSKANVAAEQLLSELLQNSLTFILSDETEAEVHWTESSIGSAVQEFDDADEPGLENSNEGITLLSLALETELEIAHSCGGFGTCGTCRVHIEEGLETLSIRNEVEAEIAMDRGFKPSERLACQTLAKSHLRVRIPQS